jgi:hypothetical protein
MMRSKHKWKINQLIECSVLVVFSSAEVVIDEKVYEHISILCKLKASGSCGKC